MADVFLYSNQKYTVSINLPGLQESFTFLTVLKPYYSTVDSVRDELGMMGADYDDANISAHIYKASLQCQFIMKHARASALGLQLNNPLYTLDLAMEYPNPPTYAMMEYTKFKAAQDLASRAYLDYVKNGDIWRKRLADMELEHQGMATFKPKDVLSNLQLQRRSWEAYLRAGPEAKSRGATRGGGRSPYPLGSRVAGIGGAASGPSGGGSQQGGGGR